MKRPPLAILAAALVLMAACGGSDEEPLSRVFQSPTWPTEERLVYQLRERDAIRGTCELTSTSAAEPGRLVLSARCASPDGRYRDDRAAEVDAATLTPFSSEWISADLQDEERTVRTATYGGTTVLLTLDSQGKRRETTRDLPAPTETSPDPGYYDEVSLFWVMRGIRLEEGYRGAFIDVNAGSARAVTTTIEVTGSERVSVPAGEFDTWVIELRTASITQMFWVERDATHRVIRARIERDLYELLP